MSIATEQKHSPTHKKEKQSSRSNSTGEGSACHEHQQWNRGKSINTQSNSNNQTPPKDRIRIHVTKKSKTLTKQTPVVASTDTAEGDEEGGGGEGAPSEGGHYTHPETERHSRQQQEDEISYNELYDTPPDYRIYQEGKVNEFFKESSSQNGNVPKTISEVCLVNDHFILVKMPSQAEMHETETVAKAQINHSTDTERGPSRKFSHYLRRKPQRIRKIAPINEESEYLEVHETNNEASAKSSKSLHCLNVNSCWRSNADDVEVYETQTRIQKSAPQAIVRIGGEGKSNKSSQTPEQRNNNNTSDDNQNRPRDLQTISGNLLKSSQHDRVMLRHSGSLVAAASDGHSNLCDLGHCRKTVTPRSRSRFYWLLRPFRGKYRKPKPKIQAVVYKSYFVKWTKPPESLYHGFGGIKSTKLAELGTSVLRRCRSAIF